jgi:hypothetical protein
MASSVTVASALRYVAKEVMMGKLIAYPRANPPVTFGLDSSKAG